MKQNLSHVKTHIREVNLRFNYLLCSFFLCFFCCYLKHIEILYLIIKFAFTPKVTKGNYLSNPAEKTITLDISTQIPQDSLGKAYENSVPESLITCNFPAYDFIYTNVTEAFYATLGACIAFSVLFCLPFLVYQSWCFLIPSRYHRERIAYRKLSFWVFTYTILVFLLILFFFLPQICQFLHVFGAQKGKLHITNQARIGPYLDWLFTTLFTLLCLSFTPLCCYLCLKANFFNLKWLVSSRKTTFFLLLIGGALLSPPDLWSQLGVTLCLFISFECVIWLYLYKG